MAVTCNVDTPQLTEEFYRQMLDGEMVKFWFKHILLSKYYITLYIVAHKK